MEHIKRRGKARKKAEAQAEAYLKELSVEEQASLLRYDSPRISHAGIEAYNWWNEALHGVARAGTATVFPVPVALAASFDLPLLERIGDCIATEGRAKYNAMSKEGDRGIYKGLTFWSPNINIFRDPRWGRGHETFGEDPFLTGRMGDAFIRGLQGEDPDFLKAAACVKHLAVHSGPEALRHEFDAHVSEKDLWETYLPAFEYCVKHGDVEGAMGGYNRLDGVPLCGNKRLIQDILRDQWGFDGYYVSDCWAIRDFHEHHMVTRTADESAAMALKAGCDINCGSCYQQMMLAYYRGRITAEDIYRSAKRALTTRILLGMHQETPWDGLDYKDVDTPEAKALNRQAAREAVVLLKNDGVLPLKLDSLHRIAVIGPNADSTIALQGNYHGTPSRFVTVMEGMEEALKEAGREEIRLLYGLGCELTAQKTERLAENMDRISEAKAIARSAEVVLLCVGLDERFEGEAHHISTGESIAGDKEDLYLPKPQQELIEAVLTTGTPVVLLNMTGSCMDLTAYENRVNAILQCWYPGALGGRAVADILTGKSAPSGKLPVTFYSSDYELPFFTDYRMKNRTYRYVEKGVLYPFGYGLTYGKTTLTHASYQKEGETHKVRFSIKNESERDLEQVVQVYKKNLHSAFEVLHTALCGFTRVSLRAGEERSGEILLDAYTFTVVNEEGKRVQDGSEYALYVGTHGPDARSLELTKEPVITIPVTVA